MRAAIRRPLVVAVAAALIGLSGLSAQAQTPSKVSDIRANPRGYANNIVTVEGFATQWIDREPQKTTAFYFLKDDWGGVIKIRTSKEKPLIGERYRVTGPVGIDVPLTKDPYISEETRVHIRPSGGEASQPVPTPVVITPPVEGLSTQTVLLIAAIVVVLILLVGLLVWLARSRSTAASADLGGGGIAPGESFAEPGGQVIEGRTIKMHAPPPGTLKILPGYLEVAKGDETVKEIRFYKVKGQSTPEVTFGRLAGPPYSHIELKQMTVSRRQAKLTYINNQWILTNFAATDSNPTRHNGLELPVDGQVALGEGDRIEMGELQFVFHAV